MKIKEFLKTTTEITHGDRIQILAGTAALMIIGFTLNSKLFKSQCDGINKDVKILHLEDENACLKKQIEYSCNDEIIEE